MAEVAISFGLFVGPPIGFVTYTYSGFVGTFLVFAGVLTAGMILFIIFYPSTIDFYTLVDPSKNIAILQEPNKVKITLSSFLTNKQCMFSLISLTLINCYLLFAIQIIAIVARDMSGLGEAQVGIFFSLKALAYAVSSMTV